MQIPAITKLGSAIPTVAAIRSVTSATEPRRVAETTPATIPSTNAKERATDPSAAEIGSPSRTT